MCGGVTVDNGTYAVDADSFALKSRRLHADRK